MTTKRKLIISITTLSIAIVAALGVTFGVLAAQNQAVVNQFSVSYTARNVSATVSASYQIKNENAVNFTVGNTESTTVTFSPADSQGEGSLTAANATLTANNDYVIFTYVFNNTAASGGHSMSVALADTSAKTNVNCYYLASAEANKGYNDIKYTTYDANDATNNVVRTAETIPSTQTVAAQGTVYFYVLVEIANNTLDASYASTSANGVSWTLESLA